MIGRRCLALLALLIVVTEPHVAAQEVGQYGDLRRIEVRGAKTFTPAAVRDGLRHDIDTLLAARPSARLLDLSSLIGKKARGGYLHAGFLDSQVRAKLDIANRRIVLTVEEGPRVLAGEVRVLGARSLPVKRLVARLTEPYPPKGSVPVSVKLDGGKSRPAWIDAEGKRVDLEPPVWKPGEPVSLVRVSEGPRFDHVEHAMADLGYHRPRIDVRLDVARETKLAHLVVEIIDEGPPAVIGKIEIAGNKKNTNEEILKYLGLQSGAKLDGDTCARATRRLWQSGRFVKSWVAIDESSVTAEAVGVRIELVEYPKAPRLSEPLSAAEQSLLKLGEWLADADRWPGDLVAVAETPAGQPLEVVVSLKAGALFTFSNPGQPAFSGVSAVIGRRRSGIYLPGQKSKLETKSLDIQPNVSLGLGLTNDPDHPFRMSFGMGWKTEVDENRSPLEIELRFDPSYFVALAHEHGSQCELRDGRLVVTTSKEMLCIDPKSGQLHHAVIFTPNDNRQKGEHGIKISFEQHGFAKRAEKIAASTADYTNHFAADQPLSSSLGYILKMLLTQTPHSTGPRDQGFLALVALAIDNRVLEPIDRLIVSRGKETGESFDIPGEPGKAEERPPPSEAFASPKFWASLMLYYADDIFPRQSWPWTFSRQIASVTLGRTEHLNAELRKLYDSPNSGPVCNLIVSQWTWTMDKRVGAFFGHKGLDRLSVEGFRNDYLPFLDREVYCGKLIFRMAEVLRQLDEKDAEALAKSLTDEQAAYFRLAVKLLQQDPDRPIEAVLPETLDALWTMGLEERVKQQLEQLRETR